LQSPAAAPYRALTRSGEALSYWLWKSAEILP